MIGALAASAVAPESPAIAAVATSLRGRYVRMQVLRALGLQRIAGGLALLGEGGTQARGGLDARCGRPDRGRRLHLDGEAAGQLRRGGHCCLDLRPPPRRKRIVGQCRKLAVCDPCHAGDTAPTRRRIGGRRRRVEYGCAIEIERKFVVASPPEELERWPSTPIEQGYIAITQDGTEVRVRRRGGDTTLTVKSGGARSRVEEEIPIDPDRFERLWPLTEGRRIDKRRYEIPADSGATIELDVYRGDLEGLVVAEIEFASDRDADAFAPPAWLGREVTDDPRYKNQHLALEGAPA
jgi:adenylate cyclase